LRQDADVPVTDRGNADAHLGSVTVPVDTLGKLHDREGVAIPHGTLAGKDSVLRDALAVVQFPEGGDWHGDRAEVCIGIAAVGDGHVGNLAQLAEVLMDEDRAAALRGATSAEEVVAILTPDEE
jgi:PTS system mannitol-specific IIA component